MAPAVESSGTQTATVGTEHSLASPTTAKTRQLVVDLTNLANGDAVELRIKRKVLSTGTVRTWQMASFAHAQSSPVVLSIPCPSPHGAEFTLKQTTGTGRSFDWSVETLD